MPAVFRVDNYMRHNLNDAVQRQGQCICLKFSATNLICTSNIWLNYFLIISILKIHGDHF